MKRYVLSINPGSTSTKFGVFEAEKEIFVETIRHSREEIAEFENVISQMDFRKDLILQALKDNDIELDELSAVVGRGGMLNPLKSGTYLVGEKMIEFIKKAPNGEHASNLGCVLAKEIGDLVGVKSYIVDPVVVDEMVDIARISGMPSIERKSIFHALNQKSVAKLYCSSNNIDYYSSNFIVAHLGGGTSVGAHESGLVIDVNNALDGDGPMAIERSGGVPIGDLYRAAFSGEYTLDEIKKMNVGNGGIVGYLDTNSGIEVAKRVESGDEYARLVFEAMAYQVAKEIGSLATVLKGKVEAILLTGGLAYNENFINLVRERVEFISKVVVYPGEDELAALVRGVLRVENGEEEAKIYE